MDWNWKQYLFYGFMGVGALVCLGVIVYLAWGLIRDAMKQPDGK